MMLAGEVAAMTDITNEMVARGDISDATYICKAMAENGHEVLADTCGKLSVSLQHDDDKTNAEFVR